MTYAIQRDSVIRTRQDLLVVGVRECQNHYASLVQQLLTRTNEFDHADWVKTSTTVNANTIVAPDGTTTAEEVIFNATADAIAQTPASPAVAVTSRAFTGSVWMKIPTGTQQCRIRVTNVAGTETGETVCALTTTWQRFWAHKLFSAVPVDNVVFRIIRVDASGDTVTTLHAWGGQLYRNPSDRDAQKYFPTVTRSAEAAATVAVNASRCNIADNGDGFRCHYSRPTCQDVDNFNAGHTWETTAAMQGLREFRFCRQDAPLPLAGADVMPYLVKAPVAAQEIDPERAVTVNERITFEFEDDAGPGLWNARQSVEGGLVNTATGAGTFWRRWSAIYRNYGNPDGYLKLLKGYVEAGAVESDFQSRGKYLIRNYETDDRRVRLVCGDRLKLTRKSIPAKITNNNYINGPLAAGDLTLTCDDGTELTEPSADYTPVIVLDPDTATEEKCNVTAIVGNVLTVQRGRWGTAAVAHTNTQITFHENAEFGTERTNPALAALGANIIDSIVSLYKYSGLSAAEIDTTTLNAERDTWLPTTVDTTEGTSYGPLIRRSLSQVTDVETLVRELRTLGQVFVWVNNAQQITGRVFAPIQPGQTLTTLDDDSNFVAGTISVDDNDESRISRVLIAYNLPTSASSQYSVAEDFLEVRVDLDVDSEEREYYGDKRLRSILDQWLQPLDSKSAESFTTHILMRFRHGARMLSAQLEIKDDDIEIGDYVRVNTEHVQDVHGANLNSVMQVLKKREVRDNRILIDLLDTGLYHRYGFFAGAGLPVYTSATTAQKDYGFFGDAVGKVGSPLELGYHFW